MSKRIDVMPCDFCKPDCIYADLSIRTTKFYADGLAYSCVRDIECSHEDVCRMQRAETKSIGTVELKFNGSNERLASILHNVII